MGELFLAKLSTDATPIFRGGKQNFKKHVEMRKMHVAINVTTPSQLHFSERRKPREKNTQAIVNSNHDPTGGSPKQQACICND